MTNHSPTLELNERMQSLRRSGKNVLNLGFGEAGVPAPAAVVRALESAAAHTSYEPVAGRESLRVATAGYLSRRGTATEADQLVMTPGSKAALFAVLSALPGELILPAPSWVSYAAQASLIGKVVHRLPIPERAGGVPEPAALESLLARLRGGAAILLLTLPDNPTGSVAGRDLIDRICQIIRGRNVVIVSDEIYRDLAYDREQFTSPVRFAPESTVVTGGLSKSVALGGWRIGFVRTPATVEGHDLRSRIIGIGSEVWSCLAAPMQAAAEFVFHDPPEVVDFVTRGSKLHQRVSQAMHATLKEVGAAGRAPEAAFYTYPDLHGLRPRLANRGIQSGQELARYLLDSHGIGVLPGVAFGDDPRKLRFRVATSLLYGSADQAEAAMNSTDPASLPWIAEALERVRSVFAEI